MPFHPAIGNENNMMVLSCSFSYKGGNDKCATLAPKAQMREKSCMTGPCYPLGIEV